MYSFTCFWLISSPSSYYRFDLHYQTSACCYKLPKIKIHLEKMPYSKMKNTLLRFQLYCNYRHFKKTVVKTMTTFDLKQKYLIYFRASLDRNYRGIYFAYLGTFNYYVKLRVGVLAEAMKYYDERA